MGLTDGTGGVTGLPKKDPAVLGASQDKAGTKKVVGTDTDGTIIPEDYKTQAGREK